MAKEADHYATLGVSPDATADEIKKAWRKGIVAHHPDRGGERERFDAIQAAWECLGDPAARASYDRRRLAPPVTEWFTGSKTGPGAGPGPTFDDFAEAFRGGTSAGGGFTGTPNDVFDYVADAAQSAWTPPADVSATLLFSFPDGEEVEISGRNRHGALVPDEQQRQTYNMGPRFVYRLLRPRDLVFRVVPPNRAVAKSPGDLFGDAVIWLLWRGPRWFKPRLRWLASTILVLAAVAGVGVSALAGTTPPGWAGVAGLSVALWWPLPRLLCLVWNRTPRWVGHLVTGAATGSIAAAVAWSGWGSVAIVTVAVAATFAVGAGLQRLRRKLLSWVPDIIKERLVTTGTFFDPST